MIEVSGYVVDFIGRATALSRRRSRVRVSSLPPLFPRKNSLLERPICPHFFGGYNFAPVLAPGFFGIGESGRRSFTGGKFAPAFVIE